MRKLLSLLFAFAVLFTVGQAHAANLTPKFGYIAPGWLPVQQFDLSAVWQAFGKTESGVSYYSLGAPANANTTYWERFDPNGDTYEAFFGAYVITSGFPYGNEWTLNGQQNPHLTPSDIPNSVNELISLGLVDQFAWLEYYNTQFGGPNPFPNPTSVSNVHVLPAPNGFFLVTFEVSTFSDLGASGQQLLSTNPPSVWVPPYENFASVVPQWQPITAIAAVFIKYDVAHQNFVAIYTSGTKYSLSDGTQKATPLSTAVQLALMASQTTFQ